MSGESNDFEVHSITTTPAEPAVDDDFVVNKIVGVDPTLKEDFTLHSVTPGDQNDFVITGIHNVSEPQIPADDDFDIDAIRKTQPVERNMPSLENSVVIGSFNPSERPVFMSGETMSAMMSHLSSMSNTATPLVELAGAPIGRFSVDRQGREFVEILAYLPFQTLSTGGSVVIPTSENSRALAAVDELSSRGIDVNAVSGWIHSHPGFTPAPSNTDVDTANKFFNEPWQITLIVDPIRKQIGVFSPDGNNGLQNKGGIAITGASNQIASQFSICEATHL